MRLFPKTICLITGAPRSGTSAVCEWLGLQPGVLAFQESRILVSVHKLLEEVSRFRTLHQDALLVSGLARQLVCEYYSSSNIFLGKKLLVDKEPLEPIAFPAKDYPMFVHNYRRIFPESKILFVLRNPIATIWSMSRRSWGESLVNQEAKQFSLEEYAANWCSCVDLLLSYRDDPNTYILLYERLVQDPETESKKIFDFLKITHGYAFQPRQTKEIGFSDDERNRILCLVQPQLERLSTHGVSGCSDA
jgi:hypothetical protein